ncbi:hypothetical protein JTM04_33480, partial [Pseudomonas aeruginosa]|nr:hypothetical protein [Pseudomonas aeruginosa]
LLEAGVDVRVVRLPQVHDTVRQGLLTCYIERAVANGAVALRGEGSNRWSAAHVDDVARLYVSALPATMYVPAGLLFPDGAALIRATKL